MPSKKADSGWTSKKFVAWISMQTVTFPDVGSVDVDGSVDDIAPNDKDSKGLITGK